jgi:hypothetical protein
MATLKNTTINSTGYITLPSGTTAQRPATPATGMMRFNTTFASNEFYNGTTWVVQGYNFPYLYYNENARADLYTANWSNTTTFAMYQFGGLGYAIAHGWNGVATSYNLTLTNLPPHQTLRYKVFFHMVDSLDNETNYINVSNASGVATRMVTFTKSMGTNGPVYSYTAPGVSTAWSGPQTYSYNPFGGNPEYNGYATIDTGYYSHALTTFTAENFLGADQAATDEAEYLTNVEVWLGV